eukprot:FR735020.1.p1 GENE.FR735020.1~~FR735020.1.p1  ORF type:complete len:165 (+),score=6.78 FR735020.1:34-495(+)
MQGSASTARVKQVGNQFYTEPCPPVRALNATLEEDKVTYTSDQLRGNYRRTCPYFEACGEINSGETCNATASGEGDAEFTFAGFVGRVTYVPENPSDDPDMVQYRVSFNNGRTEYGFALADLVLEKPEHNYEVWWVEKDAIQLHREASGNRRK